MERCWRYARPDSKIVRKNDDFLLILATGRFLNSQPLGARVSPRAGVPPRRVARQARAAMLLAAAAWPEATCKTPSDP